MNKVILMGRLTQDPSVRWQGADESSCIAKYSIAVNRKGRRSENGPDADFFNCTAFGKLGTFVEKYLKQGTKILMTGRIKNDNYTNGHGERVYSVGIIVEEIEFAESKSTQTEDAQGSRNNAQNERRGEKDTYGRQLGIQNETGGEGFMNIPEDAETDMPFV